MAVVKLVSWGRNVNILPVTGALVQRFEIISGTRGNDISDDNDSNGDV
jgi:hypothetical protein